MCTESFRSTSEEALGMRWNATKVLTESQVVFSEIVMYHTPVGNAALAMVATVPTCN